MSGKRVPFFEYPRAFLDDADRVRRVFEDVASRGAFIMQRDLESFENHLAEFTGIPHALGVANATDALELILRAVGLEPGQEVIISSHTMLATAGAIHFAGGVPVPVDIGSDHLIAPAAADAAVTDRTAGIMPTQLNGRCCDMTGLKGVADRHGLFLAEDSAQALGARFKGIAAGGFGVGGAISFYPAKVLGCLGDGGAVLTRDAGAAERLHRPRDHGRDRGGEVRGWGRNSRLDNLQAAILEARLETYPDEVVARRRRVAAMYQEMLGDCPEVGLPPAPDSDPDRFDVFQNYEITADQRDELQGFLRHRGIGTLIQWGGTPVHGVESLGFPGEGLPRTEEFFRRCIMLPMNTFVSDEDVDYVAANVREFYGRDA